MRTLHVCARVNTPNLRMLILWGRCAEVVGEANVKGQLWGEDWLLPQGLVGESVGGWSPPTRLPCSWPPV